jgi:hypothetical protein
MPIEAGHTPQQSNQEHDDPFPGKPLGDGLYEIDLNALGDDYVFFHPGMVDFDAEPTGSYPNEPITSKTELKPVDIVIFHDKWSLKPLREGFNQGRSSLTINARYFRERSFIPSINLNALRKKPNATVVRRVPAQLAQPVASLLIRYRWRPALFKAASNFLQLTNYVPFIFGKFFPDDITYESDDEYENAWQAFIKRLEPHDPIFTFDRRSLLSKLIALLTHGPFSHVATYLGDGNIWEIVTPSARVVPIEVYKDRSRYRVAAYRHYGYETMDRASQKADMMQLIGNVRYGYFGALLAGFKSYFGLHRESATPNGLILSGPLMFIAQV